MSLFRVSLVMAIMMFLLSGCSSFPEKVTQLKSPEVKVAVSDIKRDSWFSMGNETYSVKDKTKEEFLFLTLSVTNNSNEPIFIELYTFFLQYESEGKAGVSQPKKVYFTNIFSGFAGGFQSMVNRRDTAYEFEVSPKSTVKRDVLFIVPLNAKAKGYMLGNNGNFKFGIE